MPRGYFGLRNSTPIASGTSAKTILTWTPPSTGGIAQRNSIGIDFSGNDSTAAPVLVEVLRGSSGGSGSASVNPTASRASNPTGPTGGSGAEGYTGNPTGGTIIGRFYPKPYGQWRMPAGRELVQNGSEMLEMRVTAATSVNCVAFMDDLET